MNIETMKRLMTLAMQEAQQAADEGNYPFGAVITDLKGNLLASAHNTQNTDRDPTAHAEINLIRKLAKSHCEEDFNHFFLVSNAESCSMCVSASIKAGIRHYIFGAPSEPHMEPYLIVADILKYCRCKINVVYGVMEKECREQIKRIRVEQGRLAQ
jgi:tRNA(adenine34) deaminase